MKVTFLHITPLHVVASAIRECYNSHDKADSHRKVKDLGKGFHEFTDDIICGPKDKELIEKVGNINKHASTLEHLVFNIRIEGVSRLLLQEFARHRIASLSVKSTRFTLQELEKEQPFNTMENYDRVKKYIVLPFEQIQNLEPDDRDYFINSQVLQLELLRGAIADGINRDLAKYLVPDSYKTNISWTINARSLQNFIKLRSAKNAHFEIRELAINVYGEMPSEYQYLFKDFITAKF